ncbi:hypothetical protein D3C71_1595670 [compost metagenome]
MTTCGVTVRVRTNRSAIKASDCDCRANGSSGARDIHTLCKAMKRCASAASCSSVPKKCSRGAASDTSSIQVRINAAEIRNVFST